MMRADGITPFTKFRGVPPEQIDSVIESLTEAEWERLDQGYIESACHELGDWWRPMLGLHVDVDPAELFCKLYTLALARNPEV